MGKAKTLLELLLWKDVALNDTFQFVTRMKRYNISSHYRDRLAGARVPPRAGRLAANVEVAEARHLHVVAQDERSMDQVEEGFDHVFGLSLVQAKPLEQEFGQLSLCERGSLDGRQLHCAHWLHGGHGIVVGLIKIGQDHAGHPLGPQPNAEALGQRNQNLGHHGFNALIGQWLFIVEQFEPHGQTALASGHIARRHGGLIDVEEAG